MLMFDVEVDGWLYNDRGHWLTGWVNLPSSRGNDLMRLSMCWGWLRYMKYELHKYICDTSYTNYTITSTCTNMKTAKLFPTVQNSIENPYFSVTRAHCLTVQLFNCSSGLTGSLFRKEEIQLPSCSWKNWDTNTLN